MAKALGVKVPFNLDTVTKCLCPQCPVQSNSKCVNKKKQELKAALKKPLLQPEEIPGDYCASGTAACTDLNMNMPCMCFGCPVYKDYSLASAVPTCYYCRDGVAR